MRGRQIKRTYSGRKSCSTVASLSSRTENIHDSVRVGSHRFEMPTLFGAASQHENIVGALAGAGGFGPQHLGKFIHAALIVETLDARHGALALDVFAHPVMRVAKPGQLRQMCHD